MPQRIFHFKLLPVPLVEKEERQKTTRKRERFPIQAHLDFCAWERGSVDVPSRATRTPVKPDFSPQHFLPVQQIPSYSRFASRFPRRLSPRRVEAPLFPVAQILIRWGKDRIGMDDFLQGRNNRYFLLHNLNIRPF